MNALASLCVRAIVCAALVDAAQAQFVWPPAYASAPGNAVMNTPFSSPPGHPSTTTRCMVVIDAASLPFPAGTVLNRLSLRRDVSYATQSYAASSGSLTVKLGRAIAAPDRVQDVRFDRLWDGVPTTVFNAPFVVPGGPAPGTSLPPFQVVIPFTANHVWQGGPLAIEFLFTPASGSPQWRVDAFAFGARNGTFRGAGRGCAGSNGFTPMHYPLPETTMPGAVLTTQVEGLQSGQMFGIHMLGVQNATWNGLPLPVSLSLLGGPAACSLRLDPVLLQVGVATNPSALFQRATSYVPLPASPLAVGFLLYSQWLLLDSGISASLQAVVSDAQAITLGQVLPPPAPHAARTIWRYGNVLLNDAGRMVPYDYGPILRFN